MIRVYRPTHTITMSDTSATDSKQTATAPLKAKKYKVTPTVRQRRAARLIVDSALGLHPEIKSQADIVIQAGYGTTIAESPHKVLNTSGVHEALYDIGFNEDTAKKVVNEILNSDKAMHKDRLKAADMVFKVHGTYAAEKHVSLNVDANIDSQAMIELAERLRNTAR